MSTVCLQLASYSPPGKMSYYLNRNIEEISLSILNADSTTDFKFSTSLKCTYSQSKKSSPLSMVCFDAWAKWIRKKIEGTRQTCRFIASCTSSSKYWRQFPEVTVTMEASLGRRSPRFCRRVWSSTNRSSTKRSVQLIHHGFRSTPVDCRCS